MEFKIAPIVKQLQSQDWFNVSDEVEIAKGRNKLVNNKKGFKKQARRLLKSYKIYV